MEFITHDAGVWAASGSDLCSLNIAGNIIEVTEFEKYPSGASFENIIKLDKDNYLDILSGEIHAIKHGEHYGSDIQALLRSIRRFRGIVNSNCWRPSACLFITLTYAQRDYRVDAFANDPVPMTDTKKLYKDLNRFYSYMKYYLSGKGFVWCPVEELGTGAKLAANCDLSSCHEYCTITACEPQSSGSWHAHIIYSFRGVPRAPWLDHSMVRDKAWGQGFIKIESCDNIDNLGAYLSTYLTNDHGVKYERLVYYPPYFKPYRQSRNCVKPVMLKVKKDELPGLLAQYKVPVSDSMKTYVKLSEMVQGEDGEKPGQHVNFIKRTYYNRLRG